MDKIRRIGGFVFVSARKILLPACLAAAYIFVVGPLAVWARLSRLLRPVAGPRWIAVAPVSGAASDAGEQS